MPDQTEQRSSPEYLRQGLEEGHIVLVHTLEDHFEKDLVEQALADAGIPHAVRLTAETEFALVFADAQGYGRVMVRQEDAERAREIIGEIRATDRDAEAAVQEMFEE